MRRGEVTFALNLARKQIHQYAGRESIEEGGTYVKLPKTNKKERRIPIPTSLAAILKNAARELLERCMLCGISFEPAMYVAAAMLREPTATHTVEVVATARQEMGQIGRKRRQ